MTPQLETKLTYCAQLLAQSLLDDTFKDALVERLGALRETDIDTLIESLEREAIELTALTTAIQKVDTESEADWNELESRQERVAGEALRKTLADLGIPEE